MPQKIFNTATRRKEIFKPVKEGTVSIYVCGITAYDVCHIGHARGAIFFDVAVRHLRSRGYQVIYVKNFTDIDDKIIDRAKKEKVSISGISKRYIDLHNEDMAALGVENPTLAPRATEHIDDMIALISILIQKGNAYCVEGDVNFSVDKFPLYGGLSGRNLEEMVAGARIDINDKKKNPLDFALWKKSKEGEPFWESPWGKGRPGWHIECSAMSRRYLGETFDIHGGGEDLVFPHHENEIAQSQAATGKPLANYWMHNGFVRINSENSLAEARSALARCYATLQLQTEALDRPVPSNNLSKKKTSAKEENYTSILEELKEKFDAALDDDFNTAQALGYVFEAVRHMNKDR